MDDEGAPFGFLSMLLASGNYIFYKDYKYPLDFVLNNRVYQLIYPTLPIPGCHSLNTFRSLPYFFYDTPNSG